MSGTLFESESLINNQRVGYNSLVSRVANWKGLNPTSFGKLLLEGVFMVTIGDSSREYHVFLFERILLCCKEQASDSGSGGQPRWSLKGRVYWNNLTGIDVIPEPGSLSLILKPLKHYADPVLSPTYLGGDHYLKVSYVGDKGATESLVLRCRTEEELRTWEWELLRLITEHHSSRAKRKAAMLAQYL